MKEFTFPLPLRIRMDQLYNLPPHTTPWTKERITKYQNAEFSSRPAVAKKYKNFLKILPELPKNEAQPNLLGIEVEVENCGAFNTVGWTCSTDDSLRNDGKEFVSNILEEDAVNPALAGLYSWLTLVGNPEFSWRTSIHVHLNLRNFTVEEFLKLLLLYLAFEKPIFRFIGAEREHSNFCVPLRESNLVLSLTKYCIGQLGISQLQANWEKYSALNLFRLTDYGTAEFRQFPGSWDLVKLNKWIGIILCLSNAARHLEMSEIAVELKKLNTTSQFDLFVSKVFSPEYQEILGGVNPKDFEAGITACKECLVGLELASIPVPNSGMMDFIIKKTEIANKKRVDTGKKTLKKVKIPENLQAFHFDWGDPVGNLNVGALNEFVQQVQIQQAGNFNPVPVAGDQVIGAWVDEEEQF